MKKLITLLIALLPFVMSSFAGHSLGSDITYKQVDSLKYEVTLTKYRLCSSTSMSGNHPLQVSCSSGGSIVSSTLTRVSIEELKLHCTSNGSECTPQNTRITGSEGVERHVFKDTIDFTSSTFSSLASCSGTIRFAISECCRAGFVNTGSANTTQYNYAEVNLAMGNSSVELTNDPHLFQCCSQPVYYNLGALDTIERDSISYTWSCPKTSPTASVSYTGSYSCTSPFDVYYPGSLSWPFNNPTASPPIGIYLDPVTGDLTYTPTSCSEISAWVIEAIEWRHDSSGTAVIVGRTRRDLITISLTCANNNTPIINGPYSYNVCEGDQLCFNMTTADAAVTTPPPGSVTISDTLLLSWNEGIPGASFTILDSTARLKTGQFCWTPTEGSASSLPYTFTAMVDDDHCDRNRKSSRAFSVQVKKRAAASVNITNLNCGWFSVNSEIDSATFEGSTGFLWAILDSSSTPITDNSIAYFESLGSIYSGQKQDSLKVQRAGTYIIKHTINNPPNNCPTTYYDTITQGTLATTLINYPKDTIVCTGSDVVLNTTTIDVSSTLHYQWYANDSLLVNDTFTSLSITNFQSDTSVSYKIQITDTNGCTNSDAVLIHPNIPYQDKLTPQLDTCFGDTIPLAIDTTLYSVDWSNGSSDIEQYISQSELLYVLYTDTFGCVFYDSTDITIHSLPQPVLTDSTYCGTSATISPGVFDYYIWSTGESSSSIDVSTSGTYSVRVIDSNICENSDSATFTFLNAIEADLGADTAHCGPLLLTTNSTGTHSWSTGSTDDNILITQSGNYTLTATDLSGCVSSDDINVVINPYPIQTWADTINYCSNGLVTLSSDSFESYLWNNGATTRTIQAANGPYSVLFTDNLGCSNTDTIYVKINAIPAFSLGNDTTLCGDRLVMSATGGKSYLWKSGSIANTDVARSSGTYWLRLTDINDCSYTDSIEIVLLSNPNVPVLSRTGLVITSNLSGPHKWYKDGSLISGQTQNTLTISTVGNYTATTLDANDCESDVSNAIAKTLGVDKIDEKGITVYPNPASGSASVSLQSIPLNQVVGVNVYYIQGKLIQNQYDIVDGKILLNWASTSEVVIIEVETTDAVLRKRVVNIK
jgi:hypothetical protein